MDAQFKHNDYSSEEEIRIVYYLGDEGGGRARKEIHLDAIGGRLRTYIERPVKLQTTLTKLDITLGPRMIRHDVEHWKKVGNWMLAQMGISGGIVQQSKLEYIG